MISVMPSNGDSALRHGFRGVIPSSARSVSAERSFLCPFGAFSEVSMSSASSTRLAEGARLLLVRLLTEDDVPNKAVKLPLGGVDPPDAPSKRNEAVGLRVA